MWSLKVSLVRERERRCRWNGLDGCIGYQVSEEGSAIYGSIEEDKGIVYN